MNSARQLTKFTIVIPTRERCDTLYWALQTCVSQRYENLEILVSDNYSQDATREVVRSFNDPRIRYINTGQRVSMTANWEFALAHVDDGYVTYIGDDDGLLPGALVELDHLIAETKTEAVAWQKAEYYWPNCWVDSFRDTLNIPLRRTCKSVSAREMLAKLVTFQISYLAMPCLYNSFVHREGIRRAQHGNERFFRSMIPDVYSGVALASVLDHYVYSQRPYSVSGISGHSAGASFLYAYNVIAPQSSLAVDAAANEVVPTAAAATFFAENDLTFHPLLVRSPAIAIFTAESVLQARDYVPAARNLVVDMRAVLTHALQEAAASPAEKYTIIVDAVRQIGVIHHLEAFVEDLITRYPYAPRDHHPTIGLNIIYRTLRLRTDEFGVDNIFTATQLCRSILILSEGRYHSFIGVLRTSADFADKLVRRWLNAKMAGLISLRASTRLRK